jgi:hypothetical protein
VQGSDLKPSTKKERGEREREGTKAGIYKESKNVGELLIEVNE